MRAAAFKNSLKPFCLEYQPLLEEILQKEAVLRELMEGATMAQILGRALVICSGNRHTNRVHRELRGSSGYEGYYRCVGKFVERYLGALVPYRRISSQILTL